MKKTIALLLVLTFCLGLAACGTSSADTPAHTPEPQHKIGVIVYNTGDNEVIGFREYLKGYIESNFEMVEFVYSGSITSGAEELDFIQKACDEGVEGFMSFLSHDLAAEVALCEKNRAYYLLASGTVADNDFEAVADNPWFLGMFGPGRAYEFQAGADMAGYFARQKIGNRYFILSGGAPLGNEMHYQRTFGILNALAMAYGVSFNASREELAATDKPITLETGELTVTICPGYVARENYLKTAKAAYGEGSYDAVLSVLPPEGMVEVIGNTPLGVIDAYHTRNLQLVNDGTLRYVVGKYSSMIGPAFAMMLNAVTGHAADFRGSDGRAIRVTQGFWESSTPEDYVEKYTLSTSVAKNAYNFDDLSKVIRLYNPDASLPELVALAEACSYYAVEARRSTTAQEQGT